MDLNVRKPNFLTVGAQKSGSTTLHFLLKQHPEVFLPEVKEPLYFIADIIKNISSEDIGFKNEGIQDRLIYDEPSYLKLFESVNGKRIIGESSASYLYYYEHCIPRIKELLGDPKIIIILREPVSKIFSQYKHLQKDHGENRSFEEALRLEPERIRKNFTAMYHYRAQGLYSKQVAAYLDSFSNVLVLLNDDLKNDPGEVARKCYEFLGVDASFTPETKDYNISSKRIRNLKVHKMLYNRPAHQVKMVFKSLFGSKFYDINTDLYKKMNIGKINVTLKDETRKELKEFFREDIEKLEKILNRDLSAWKADRL